MSFFKTIANWISEKNQVVEAPKKETDPPYKGREILESEKESEDARASKGNSTAEKKADAQIEDPEELVKILCKKIAERFRYAGCLVGKQLVVWLADNVSFHAYNTSEYKNRIRKAIEDECGVVFGSVEFRDGRPADELNCEEVGNSRKVFIEIKDKQPDVENVPNEAHVCKKASISIHNNRGSLLERKYILSSDEMRNNAILAYNIGVEQFPEGEQRENHIVIDGNLNSPMYNLNKYVSRSHAHIFYSEKYGFCLQADRGIPKNEKSTCILRNGMPIELRNTIGFEPLEDGDIIVLSDAVRLLYVDCD